MRFVLYPIIFITLIFSLSTCSPSTTILPKVFSPLIMDYPHLETPNQLFYSADSLKWEQNYSASNEKFEEILEKSTHLTIEDSLYCMNQLVRNNLWLTSYSNSKSYLVIIENIINLNKIEDNGILADFHFNKGWFLKEKRRGEEAFNYLFIANNLYQKLYPPGHLQRIHTLNEIGFTYREFSNQLDSCIHYLEISESEFQKSNLPIRYGIKVFFGIASISLFKRDHSTGLAAINLAIINAYKYRSLDTIMLGRLHSKKGDLLKKIGHLFLAKDQYQKAILLGEYKQKNNIRLQEFYRNLAITNAHEKDSVHFFKNLQKLQVKFNQKPLIYANLNRLLGKYYEINGNHEKSINYHLKAIKQYEQEKYPDELFFMRNRYSLAHSYNELEKYDSTIHFLLYDLLRIPPPENYQPNWEKIILDDKKNVNWYFVLLGEIANTLIKKYNKNKIYSDDLKEAIQIFQLVDSVLIQNLNDSEETSLTILREVAAAIYPSATRAALYMHDISQELDYLNLANTFMDRLKSSIMFKEIIKEEGEYRKLIIEDNNYEELLREKLNNPKFYCTKLDLEINQEIYQLIQKKKNLKNKIKGLNSSLYDKHQEIPKIKAIQNKINQNQSIIQYHFDKNDWVISIIGDKTIKYIINDKIANLDSLLEIYKKGLSTPILSIDSIKNKSFLTAGFKLYKLLIQPVNKYLTTDLIIIPDGAINNIPFEALLTNYSEDFNYSNPETFPFLIKKHNIQYAFSLKTAFHNLENTNFPKKPKILAYAYSGEQKPMLTLRSKTYGDLWYSSLEINSIANHFNPDDCMLFFKKGSTKDNFLNQKLENIDLIHFALHASYDPNNRYKNKIIFRNSNNLNQPTPLFAYEILKLNINAALVVLSACNTGIGKFELGEGTYSLSKAFRQAGAKQVISSLWEIDDYATSILMDRFYFHLSITKNTSDALRKAKLDYISNTKTHQANPLSWSGLVLYN